MHDADRYRLPTTVVPSRYELELAPDLAAATFAGTVAIAVDVREPVGEIVLNALELDIDQASLELPDGTRIDAAISLDPGTERATLRLASTAPAGAATVHARFRGALNSKLNGFYRSTFTTHDGPAGDKQEHIIATTQMEATYARKAFPCWDEPAHKAVFAVSLVVPEGLTALSNGAEVGRDSLGGGRVRVRFADTMKMSTYLVAFVVGPLEVTDAVDVLGVPVRVACPPGKTHLAPYALDVAEAGLRYFTDYYAIEYAGGKIDLVAIPDFAFGAMENTGCITFREVLLLAEPPKSTHPELLNVTDVINHELAHMWFGNLVTMGWWEGIWLNEAFATFMEMKATESYRPDWNRWTEFGLSRTAAFDTDALDSTRPIEYPVVSPADAEGMFDVLTYEKGGAVLRMLEQYLGEDRFRDGIRLYLQRHSYGNTVTTDLWDAIEEASGEPVRRIMDTWIYQGGHPMVEVDLTGATSIRLRQERFRLSAAADPDGDVDTSGLGDVWAVPVVLRASVDGVVREERVLLDGRELDVDLGGAVDWVLLNAGGSGFYRVRYTAAKLERLVRAGVGNLEVLERYGLLDDAMAAVVAGSMTAVEFLDLARAYGDETDVSVWRRLRDALAELNLIVDDEGRDAFHATVRALASPALRRVGFAPTDGDDDRTRELRGVLLYVAAVLGDDHDAVAEARRLRAAGIAEPGSVDPPLFAAATTVVAETGGAEDFATAVDRWRDASTPQEEVRELYNLGRFHDPELIDRACELAVSEVRTQNAPFLLRFALHNRTAGPRVWSFIARNWDAINDRFPSNSIVRMLEGITGLADEAVAADVQAFFAEHEVPQGTKQLSQHLERQRATVALKRREGTTLAAALRS